MVNHSTGEQKLLLRIRGVIEATSLSRSQIYRLMTQGRFPRSYKISEGVTCWRASDIYRWVKERTEVAV